MKQDDLIRMIDEIAQGMAKQVAASRLETPSKYQFSRKWYKADFYYTDCENIADWCGQQFGPSPVKHDAWSRWWHNGQDRVFFRDEQDYLLFLLRWS